MKYIISVKEANIYVPNKSGVIIMDAKGKIKKGSHITGEEKLMGVNIGATIAIDSFIKYYSNDIKEYAYIRKSDVSLENSAIKTNKKSGADGDNKDWVNKGMVWGGIIGVSAGITIALLWNSKDKKEKTGKLIVMASIGLLAGSGIGYGGKKFIMS